MNMKIAFRLIATTALNLFVVMVGLVSTSTLLKLLSSSSNWLVFDSLSSDSTLVSLSSSSDLSLIDKILFAEICRNGRKSSSLYVIILN